MDDSIRLRIFQRALTGATSKLYIELSCNSFVNFNSLSMAFLTHFQFPIWYETGTKILTSLRQYSSTHMYVHIHEWRRHKWLIKAPILDQILVDWFTKSLLPPIVCDVSMGGVVIEKQAINHAQYLDLVYFESGTL